jgi:hypothetical protein
MIMDSTPAALLRSSIAARSAGVVVSVDHRRRYCSLTLMQLFPTVLSLEHVVRQVDGNVCSDVSGMRMQDPAGYSPMNRMAGYRV